METETDQDLPPLEWDRMDFERRLGLPGSKYTHTSKPLTFALAIVMTVAFYGALAPFTEYYIAKVFLERGVVPYVIVLLTSWSLATLLVKWRKLALQIRALKYRVVPRDVDFVLAPQTVKDVMDRLYMVADRPAQFVLFNRIQRALSSLKNIGRISDIDDILRSQAENDENFTDTTYGSVRALIWAIPVMGFIGTVLGLSSAIGGFGAVLATTTDTSQLRSALQNVTGGLSVAFETTLIGLVAAVIVHFAMSGLKQKEDLFLDACSEYCHRWITTKLRTVQVDEKDQVEGAL
jgi:biopolymer transport protein ExbB/TolQ